MDKAIEHDIELAVRLLKDAGATEVYVFGSAATGEAGPESDIDLAVRGISPERFIRTMSKVTLGMERPFDLLDLDQRTPFVEFLVRRGKLRRVG